MRKYYLKVSVVMVALPLLYLADVTPGSSPVEYQNCGGVFFRRAFQGNNLVYVVQ